MKNKKLKVAITGSIGSGKSAFCSMLEEKGFTVLKADDISKDILSNDKSVQQKIIKIFGENSFINGKPDKLFLAEKVFSDPKNVVKINSILHPKVIEIISKKTDEILEKNNLVFVEAALIYEADMEDLFDYVVLVAADEKIRMNRKQDTLSSEEFLKRNENQIPDEEKKKRADFIFENNESLEDLKAKADLLILILSNN
jgi:dephospho-CoA kinase